MQGATGVACAASPTPALSALQRCRLRRPAVAKPVTQGRKHVGRIAINREVVASPLRLVTDGAPLQAILIHKRGTCHDVFVEPAGNVRIVIEKRQVPARRQGRTSPPRLPHRPDACRQVRSRSAHHLCPCFGRQSRRPRSPRLEFLTLHSATGLSARRQPPIRQTRVPNGHVRPVTDRGCILLRAMRLPARAN
jgi:hypothetical protein